ncbi:MAG: MazG family protein [Clostridia bacterium]|nr:MazG family protein [Clostridia bacterium]
MQTKEEIKNKTHYSFDDLYDLMAILRAPGGCPWDREQTHNTIRMNMLEEAYEAVDAIDKKDDDGLCEELGDLLMQVIFHEQIAQGRNAFTMEEILDGVCRKLIVRHPHVFGDVKVNDSGEVLSNWESIKNQTKGMETLRDTLDGIATALPTLMRAQKIVSRTKKQNRDVRELMPEPTNEKERIGKALFTLALEAKELGIDAEEALGDYNNLCLSRA